MSLSRSWMQRPRHSWLWWKHTGWFQMAHKPLCKRFRRDTVRIGSLHICRSCLFLHGGFLAAAGGLLLFRLQPPVHLAACYSLLLPVLALSHPRIYIRWTRQARDVLRLALGASLALVCGLALTGVWALLAITIILLLGVRGIYTRKRAQGKRGACAGCPELGVETVCSGYARQADSIRAFRQEMEEILNGEGALPPVIQKSCRISIS